MLRFARLYLPGRARNSEGFFTKISRDDLNQSKQQWRTLITAGRRVRSTISALAHYSSSVSKLALYRSEADTRRNAVAQALALRYSQLLTGRARLPRHLAHVLSHQIQAGDYHESDGCCKENAKCEAQYRADNSKWNGHHHDMRLVIAGEGDGQPITLRSDVRTFPDILLRRLRPVTHRGFLSRVFPEFRLGHAC